MGSVVKRFDVVAGRKYQSRNGEEKTHWINCGEGVEWDDGGITIRLHAVPVGTWFDGSMKLFERKEREQNSNGQRNSSQQRQRPAQRDSGGSLDPEDDIPFAPPFTRRTWSALT